MTSAAEKGIERAWQAEVFGNAPLCHEHYCLTLRVTAFAPAAPGQFVHIGPHVAAGRLPGQSDDNNGPTAATAQPFLRRAFSLAGVRRRGRGAELDIIYRVVGTGTRWLSTLHRGDGIAGIGPLGHGFVLPPRSHVCWLVAGGVGLPPLQWLAQELVGRGNPVVLFLGARNSKAIPIDFREHGEAFTADALDEATLRIATDDGSAGFAGNVVTALVAYADRRQVDAGQTWVYTCGPEVMMAGVARFCAERKLPGFACMERAMACGVGTCQSCVVPVRDDGDPDGWRYDLCCTQGPVFEASAVLWGR
ncbi:MAG: dihydroorotate dehydrogenase electron transfer subunit [bacterium]|nr:dihydroorotate dehydrogenase electron transfer subunit [bacterium]